MKLSIVMPCLNEIKTLPICIQRAKALIDTYGISGEILVSDNGSTDGSWEIAETLGARVVHCPVRGYGAALQYGIENAQGDYIIIGDSDDSYHFDEAYPIIKQLDAGYDVCMGTRLKGTIVRGAMPRLNRMLGNPVLTLLGRIFFDMKISDFHCGMRGFKRQKVLDLGLVTTGMEWASEHIIKSKLHGLRITEVPITLYRDGRSRPPHLRPWRDGWRHLRFMLLHAPKWLFIYPGIALIAISSFIGTILLFGEVRIDRINFDVHTLLTMAFMAVVGTQMVFTGVIANLYAHLVGILPTNDLFLKRVKKFSLERLFVVSLTIGLSGVMIYLFNFWLWYAAGFPNLDYAVTMRRVIPGLTLIVIAVQALFNGFMVSILFIKTSGTVGNEIRDRLDNVTK